MAQWSLTMKVREFNSDDAFVSPNQEVRLFGRFNFPFREVSYEAFEALKPPSFDVLLGCSHIAMFRED
ncbi:hypothetical protein WT07_28190 [Burkholderia stagnalis]|nr:hypothetical protein WT07_28190 [Burkholderia stagnalis]KWE13442.1 hypothetical protein WT47_03290 [Burkholderia stagnalis]KWE17113.1 hypothetical protein WT48_14905 [Burkholderia stagnalis]KWO82944.1 hypothetical protein WU00_30580 [Burkholderia stagnalis]